MKKKLFSVMLVAALATSLLAGCGKNKKTDVDNTETQSVVESTQSTEADKVITVSSDMANITGNLGKGVALDCVAVSTDTEEYMAVEEYLKDTNATFEMYDINLLDKSKNKVQPDGMVEVSVKLSDNMKNAAGDTYVVFHNKGTDFTKIACTEKDGYVTFKTNHFSIYTVVKYDTTEPTIEQKIEKVEETTIPAEEVKQFESAVEETKKSNNGKIDVVSNGEIVSDNTVNNNTTNDNNTNDNNGSISNDNKNDDSNNNNNGGNNNSSVNDNKNNNNNDNNTNTGNTTQEPAQQPEQPKPSEPEQPAPEPTQPSKPEEDFDGYDRFGNKFVEKYEAEAAGAYMNYLDADNPYQLNTYVWADNDKCLYIIKDIGVFPASEINEKLNVLDTLNQSMINMWDEKNSQDNRGVTFIPVVIGCYNGHWIVKYELIIADDLDKYTSEVFFYDKNGNPWRA